MRRIDRRTAYHVLFCRKDTAVAAIRKKIAAVIVSAADYPWRRFRLGHLAGISTAGAVEIRRTRLGNDISRKIGELSLNSNTAATKQQPGK